MLISNIALLFFSLVNHLVAGESCECDCPCLDNTSFTTKINTSTTRSKTEQTNKIDPNIQPTITQPNIQPTITKPNIQPSNTQPSKTHTGNTQKSNTQKSNTQKSNTQKSNTQTTSRKSSDGCTITDTAVPTVTVIKSYSREKDTVWATFTQTKRPKDAIDTCQGSVVTTTSTITTSASAIEYFGTERFFNIDLKPTSRRTVSPEMRSWAKMKKLTFLLTAWGKAQGGFSINGPLRARIIVRHPPALRDLIARSGLRLHHRQTRRDVSR
ncbi:uncharacterized protein GGS25DRAFT_97150 [Hypoxylon fragiforme]|uniref:uncharacterized protein n=1 Tax=Hypoxylon fragiforme TaxID=63214 RepID=UPI0020C72C7C|nr:uncharacterized protein GGS25DRAFT_97150 [Hypoxylon fragiforme]KAI2603531.1 hypothetical protein GGS25DRAFT_97150 [Hypoxylon fragiforme]